jgi:PadR family transcriptional regulator PadR
MRRTAALVNVAAALLSNSAGRHWGYDLSRSAGVRSGVLYPMLHRLLEAGWLSDGWEQPAGDGKQKAPPRRYYELTDLGRAELASLVGAAPTRGRTTRRSPAGYRTELA